MTYKAPCLPRPLAPAMGSAVADMERRVGDMHRICKVIETNGLEAYRYVCVCCDVCVCVVM